MKKFKMKTIKALSLLLVLCLTVSLAACGGGAENAYTARPDTGGMESDIGGGGGVTTLRDEGYAFVSERIAVDIAGMGHSLLGYARDTLFLQYETQELNELGETVHIQTLASMNTDGTGIHAFWQGSSTIGEEDSQLNKRIVASTVLRDGGLLAIRQESETFLTGDVFGSRQEYYLMHFSPDGRAERETNLADLLGITPGVDFFRIQAMSDGRILVDTWEKLYVLSADLQLQSEFSWDIENFALTRDDRILVSTSEAQGTKSWFFDLETGTVQGNDHPVFEEGLDNAQAGLEYDLYIGTEEALFGFDLSTEQATRLFHWIEVDAAHPPVFQVSDSGDIFFFEPQWGDPAEVTSATLVRLTKVPASEVPEKEIIVYGGLFVDYAIRQEIVAFNSRSNTHRIVVREYADWRDRDHSNAIARLNMDIIAGNAPDIIDFGTDLPHETLARRGFLIDLGALIETDGDIRWDDLLVSVFDTLRVDGALYAITPEITIQTLVGRSERVGPDMGWTMEEFLAAIEALPEGGSALPPYVTRQSFLNSLVGASLGLFVDGDTGRANFDSPLFAEYLRFVRELPTREEIGGDGTGLPNPRDATQQILASPHASGQPLLSEKWVARFVDLPWLEDNFGGQVSFKGFPGERGIGSVITPRGLIGISAGSRHQEAAWNFVRSLLREEWQRGNVQAFATNRNILQEQMQESIRTTDDMVVTQAQANQVMALIERADLISMRDTTVLEMIEEEALPFFAGDRSIEETVRIIQNRVQTYLSERG